MGLDEGVSFLKEYVHLEYKLQKEFLESSGIKIDISAFKRKTSEFWP